MGARRIFSRGANPDASQGIGHSCLVSTCGSTIPAVVFHSVEKSVTVALCQTLCMTIAVKKPKSKIIAPACGRPCIQHLITFFIKYYTCITLAALKYQFTKFKKTHCITIPPYLVIVRRYS